MAETSPKLEFPRRVQRTWRDDISAEWTRWTSRFTRESVISNIKTLAWVVPLTLLIWIYAEREQVQPAKDVAVPFEFASIDPNRLITLKPPQDKNLVLELQGPQAKLQELLNRLTGGQMPQGLKLTVSNEYASNQDHSVPTLSLVRNQKIFADYGVTVLTAQPPKLEITIDDLVERDAAITPPPRMENVQATFDPATVKVRGPLSVLNRAMQSIPPSSNGRLTVYAQLPDQVLRSPGKYENVEVLSLIRPAELSDERIAIVGNPKVHATIDVRQADKKLTIRSMPVTLDTPAGLLDKYTMDPAVFKGVVQNVELIGPPEIIDEVAKPGFQPQPKARLRLTQEDATGEIRSKIVEYDLPKGLEVNPDDKKKTIEFRLVDRATQ